MERVNQPNLRRLESGSVCFGIPSMTIKRIVQKDVLKILIDRNQIKKNQVTQKKERKRENEDKQSLKNRTIK